MDEKTAKIYKMKYFMLTIMLNVIVLLIAGAILAFVFFDNGYIMAGVMLAAVVPLTLSFRKRYHKTKAWLDEQT